MSCRLAVFGACHRALQIFEIVGRRLEQGLDVGGNGFPAFAAADGSARQARLRRQPFFEIVVEAVLRLARLQIAEAEHDRARKPEQRCAEGRPHAGQRCFEAGLQIVEEGGRVGRGR